MIKEFLKVIIFIIILVIAFSFIEKLKKIEQEEKNKNKVLNKTELLVHNSYSKPVDVYLTIGCPDKLKWVSSVKGIFGIKTDGLKGKFTLKANETLSYISDKGIQGNICFLTDSYQCLNDSTNGTTIIEFCLNNEDILVPNAQETVEISCVSGVSYIASIDLTGGRGVFTANHIGYDTVSFIENSTIGNNSGKVGVYPYGCDNCTWQSNQAPECSIGKNEKPQKYAICNVQRLSKLSGGKVQINFINKVD